MARTPSIAPAALDELLERCSRLGYDASKIERVVHDAEGKPPSASDVPPTPQASIVVH